MSDPKSFGRDLRALWATLGVICLLGAGIAYGVTRYRLMELERAATREARKVAVEVIQPAVTAADASAPMRGARYESMLSAIEERVLVGPIVGVRIWSAEGTIVFADDRELVGERVPAMRDDVLALTTGPVRGFVTGQRFRTLVLLRVDRSPTSLAAELVRPHGPLVARAQDPWYPWVGRAIRVAIAFAVLYVITWVGFLGYDVVRRRVERRRSRTRRETDESGGSPTARREEEVPAYMRPGFREEVETMRRVERELSSSQAERDELARRLQQAELELEKSKATSSVSEPA